jgi:hypothetical protein
MKVKSDPLGSASSGAVKGISTPRDREKWQNEEVKTLGILRVDAILVFLHRVVDSIRYNSIGAACEFSVPRRSQLMGGSLSQPVVVSSHSTSSCSPPNTCAHPRSVRRPCPCLQGSTAADSCPCTRFQKRPLGVT